MKYNNMICLLFAIFLLIIGCSNNTSAIDPPVGKSSLSLSSGGIYDVTSYGADQADNPSHDDGQGIQAAIAAATAAGGGKVIFPFGTYNIKSPLVIASNGYASSPALELNGGGSIIRMECASGRDQNGNCLDITDSVISASVQWRLQIHNLLILANKTSQYGIKGYKLSEYQTKISNVKVEKSISHGFLLEESSALSVEDCASKYNGGDGFFFAGSNASRLTGLYSYQNSGNGITITSHTNWTGALFLNNFTSEMNTGDGVNIALPNGAAGHEVAGTIVRDGWIEANQGDGIRVGARNALIEGNRIIAGGSSTSTRGIRITSDRGVSIIANRISGTTNSATYALVMLESHISHQVSGNTSIYVGATLKVCSPDNIQVCNDDLNVRCGYPPQNPSTCNQAYTTCGCITP